MSERVDTGMNTGTMVDTAPQKCIDPGQRITIDHGNITRTFGILSSD